MQIFKRHRTLDEIRALCEQQGVELRTALYEGGSDYVSLHSPGVNIFYDPALGRFLGTVKFKAHIEIAISSDRDMTYRWYQALVHFFYTDEDPK